LMTSDVHAYNLLQCFPRHFPSHRSIRHSFLVPFAPGRSLGKSATISLSMRIHDIQGGIYAIEFAQASSAAESVGKRPDPGDGAGVRTDLPPRTSRLPARALPALGHADNAGAFDNTAASGQPERRSVHACARELAGPGHNDGGQ